MSVTSNKILGSPGFGEKSSRFGGAYHGNSQRAKYCVIVKRPKYARIDKFAAESRRLASAQLEFNVCSQSLLSGIMQGQLGGHGILHSHTHRFIVCNLLR